MGVDGGKRELLMLQYVVKVIREKKAVAKYAASLNVTAAA